MWCEAQPAAVTEINLFRPANYINLPNISEVEPLPYIMSSSVEVSQNLNFTLEGGDPSLEVPLAIDGKRTLNADLITCFRRSILVPPQLYRALPQKIVVTPTKHGFIPDFGFAAMLGSSFVVSERFVSLMNEIDPSSQQFLRISEAVDDTGAALDSNFYLMNVLLRLEAVDIANSTVEWKSTADGEVRYLEFRPSAPKDRRLVLLERVVAGHSLWRGPRHQFPRIHFCSERLKEAMRAAGLSELRLQYVAVN